MGIPIEYHMLFCMLSIMFFIMILSLLFIQPTFNQTTAAFILCFLNIVISLVAGAGFFAFDLYGYDNTGTLVTNVVNDYDFLGLIFIILAYISLIMLFYCIYLWYEKPWVTVKKIEGNPYVNYKY